VGVAISRDQHQRIDAGRYMVTCEYYDAAGRKYQTRRTIDGSEIIELMEDGSERRMLGS
jgi:hypothetical protein